MLDLLTPGFVPATFSPCRSYRYRLERRWGDGPVAAFIMLNPSRADETKDDPTIRRCIGFAKSWGMSGIVIGNLFALRSTDPKALYGHADPVGPENDAYLAAIADEVETLICAWGAHGAFRDRGKSVLASLRHRKPQALSLTKAGHPGHPLYLAATSQPVAIFGERHEQQF